MYWTWQSYGCHKCKSKSIMCMSWGHWGDRERMEVQLYSFLALALEISEYSASLNGSAACNRAPVTQGIGGWVAYSWQKIKIMSYNSSISCIYIDLYMISGFCRNTDVTCSLMGYYTVSSDNSLPMFWDSLLVPPKGQDEQVILKHW